MIQGRLKQFPTPQPFSARTGFLTPASAPVTETDGRLSYRVES